MSIVTSQQITKYYQTFRTIDVTFTREVVKSTGLQPPQVFLKCLGEQWPCVVYSSSFDGARVLAPTKDALMDRIKKANGLVSLRMAFRQSDKVDAVTFFVAARITGYAPYQQSNGSLQFINMQYTQRPPDDYVEIMGRMLEANINSARRKDERILVTPDSMRKLGLLRKETVFVVQGVPRKCIVRDLSFAGAKIIVQGLAKYLVGKECRLRLEMDDPDEILDIEGDVIRYEDVEGRKDLAAVAIHFTEASVPMTYKMHLNDYLSQARKSTVDEDQARGNPA